ncbi:hypothetical protein EMIHUDRAFT_96665 [Emiliania huxleyi CCMP1516]|uniref:Uncharacterized protein n=2 Tax=Emiliania huxleyi TaxID=2903 RepID=A0A0D3IDQ2_EMIH1|nr:hypothetical protein EMIHUDRAFT_96665 [Emiliania huxleyi CCMP1516]EOD09387.1 hypothetical protein EMIHUDRAFT_96665 [Emiliania huxleyi CCMP1516]|eukprot:XP_005761816.1 hypothetical protein EMIHUDRAFT_96665 [Emiliania huxleyi CCMP1516]
MSELDTPPLVLWCGCMGLAGVVLTLCVVYPAYYHLPGDDHGRFEDFYNTRGRVGAASFVQLGGFGLLLLGMAVYNGTTQLPGGPRATEHPILDMEASVRLSLMGPTAFRTSRMSVKNPSLKQKLVEP